MLGLVGWYAAEKLPEAPAPDPLLKINYNPITSIISVLKTSFQHAPVLRPMLGIAWFYGFSNILILVLPVLVADILKYDASVLIYVLVASTVGILIGSLLCLILAKGKEARGLVAFGIVGVMLFTLDLYLNTDASNRTTLGNMDAFIAVTGNSETNIMSCLVAKSKGVKKTIALVENMDYFQLSHSIGIDTLINKKLLAANNIFRYIRKGEIVAMAKLNNMNAEILEFLVTSNSVVCNKLIKKIDFPRSAIIGGIIRDGEGMIALGNFNIIAGDRVVVCCLPQSIKKVEKLFF